jgi:hypothetical protein
MAVIKTSNKERATNEIAYNRRNEKDHGSANIMKTI